MPTCPTHVGPTVEELARRARCRELRTEIAKLADFRARVNRAYRLPHAGDAHRDALTAIMVQDRLVYRPARRAMRWQITELHVELAALRGKRHRANESAQVG